MNGMAGFAGATSWTDPAVQAVAWALIQFVWQGAVVGVLAAAALAALRRTRASTRYAVATGALLIMVLLPAVTVLSAARGASAPEAASARPAAAAAAPALPAPPPTVQVRSVSPSAQPWIVGLWLAGVALLSVYNLGGWLQARRLTRDGRAPGERLEAMARALCRRLGIDRAVTLLESTAVDVPTVLGWLRPVVLVPASTLAGLTPQQLEAVLAHELAHVRRHDYLVNLFQTAAETLLFYHPAVWWVSAQVRRERENCCDDLAVAVCGDRLVYARALADLEGLRAAGPRLALAANGGSLGERVRRIVGAPACRSPRRPWAAGLLATALLVGGAGFQLACDGLSVGVVAEDPAGHWTASPEAGEVRLEVKLRRPFGSWELMDTYPASRLAGFHDGNDVRFELRSDAGTFRFHGAVHGGRGKGDASFEPNPAYLAVLMGAVRPDDLLTLAAHDVSLDYARSMREVGYLQVGRRLPSGGSLRAVHDRFYWHIHDALTGPPSVAERLSALRIHGVTPEYVRALRAAGYSGLGPWDAVELREHGIEAAWVQGLADAGYTGLGAEDLVSLHAHGIDGGFLRRAAQSHPGRLSVPEILSLQARGEVAG